MLLWGEENFYAGVFSFFFSSFSFLSFFFFLRKEGVLRPFFFFFGLSADSGSVARLVSPSPSENVWFPSVSSPYVCSPASPMYSFDGVEGLATRTVDTWTSLRPSCSVSVVGERTAEESRPPGVVDEPGSVITGSGLVSPLFFLSMILLYSSSSSLLTLSNGFFAYGDLNTVAWCWKSLWMIPLLAAPIFIPPYPSTWLVWASCMFLTS